jgi:hypothetical protein
MANRSNISLVGNTTTGQNLGTGAGVYKNKSGANNLRFRSISGIGEGIWVFEQGDEIRISGATAGTITGVSTAQNVGSGSGIFDSKFVNILQLRSLYGSGNTTITTSGQTVIINSTGGVGSVTSAQNVGSGAGLYSGMTGTVLKFRSLLGSGGTTITNSGGTAIIYSSGGGGFLGTVTQSSAEPSNLKQNQWVKPEPTAGGVFSYTFTNFKDSTDTAINVNLSLEDVYLRYCDSGYWSKESYNRPITSGYTWIGHATSNCVCEVPVIDEWVDAITGLQYIGQKFTYPTQSVLMTDLGVCTLVPNYIYTQNIPLNAIGNTAIMTIPTGKCVLFNRFKLIIRQDAPVTTFCVSIGNVASTYCNLSPLVAIANVLTNETYDLEVTQKGTPATAGSTVYFRVSTASACATLCGNLLTEGFIY